MTMSEFESHGTELEVVVFGGVDIGTCAGN